MAVSKGRNEIQASIEDNAAMLVNMAQEICLYYSNKCSEISIKIGKLRKDNETEEFQILSSMLSLDSQLLDWYEELKTQTLKMFIPKVYSYAEKHIEGMLNRKLVSTNKISKEYKKDHNNVKGVSDIEKGCYLLCNKNNILYEQEMSKWVGFDDFHSLRKSIEHRYKEQNANIDVDYIINHIENAKKMLSTLELLTR